MCFLRLWVTFFILLYAFSLQSYAAAKQDKVYRSFWHPHYHGQSLNYCALDGSACGISIADQYCKKLGYDYSYQAIRAPNVGLTHYLNCPAICKGWQCDGFMVIGCATHLTHSPPKSYHYREKLFVYPRFNHYRVNWCYKKNQGCGARAANAFCMHKGFMQAKRFCQQSRIQATAAIGNKALCFGKECKAFKYIICYR